MKRPPPFLKLSTDSAKTVEMVAGALALSALGWQERDALLRRAEAMVESLRKMGGSRR